MKRIPGAGLPLAASAPGNAVFGLMRLFVRRTVAGEKPFAR